MYRLPLFLLLPLLVLLTPSRSAVASTSHSASVHGVPVSDAQIESTLRTKLAKSKIGRDGFRFRVQRGVVTWEGSTSIIQHKGSATRMAKAAGASQVINNIQVSAAARQKAAGNLKKAAVVE